MSRRHLDCTRMQTYKVVGAVGGVHGAVLLPKEVQDPGSQIGVEGERRASNALVLVSDVVLVKWKKTVNGLTERQARNKTHPWGTRGDLVPRI